MDHQIQTKRQEFAQSKRKRQRSQIMNKIRSQLKPEPQEQKEATPKKYQFDDEKQQSQNQEEQQLSQQQLLKKLFKTVQQNQDSIKSFSQQIYSTNYTFVSNGEPQEDELGDRLRQKIKDLEKLHNQINKFYEKRQKCKKLSKE